LEAYRFNEYAATGYRFTWNTFCDWFVELAKPMLSATGPQAEEVRDTAAHVLGTILRLLHPVMPFVTETLWDHFGYGPECSLIRAPWPSAVPVHEPEAARRELDWVVRLVSEIRAVRSEMNVPPGILAPVLLKDAGPETLARAATWGDPIRRLARVSELAPLTGDVPRGSAQAVLDETTLILPLAELIDFAVERARLLREREKAEQEAGKIASKLANEDFVRRAPDEVVEENRDRLAAARQDIARLDAALQRIA
jgi:valyl-tRNA synthetase